MGPLIDMDNFGRKFQAGPGNLTRLFGGEQRIIKWNLLLLFFAMQIITAVMIVTNDVSVLSRKPLTQLLLILKISLLILLVTLLLIMYSCIL